MTLEFNLKILLSGWIIQTACYEDIFKYCSQGINRSLRSIHKCIQGCGSCCMAIIGAVSSAFGSSMGSKSSTS